RIPQRVPSEAQAMFSMGVRHCCFLLLDLPRFFSALWWQHKSMRVAVTSVPDFPASMDAAAHTVRCGPPQCKQTGTR
ncbi:hypothetical protein, partial [Arthrobacter sp. ISL-28]|uniref:hypothetical protein n=1 Tax=Arthrobacter sp. ISL-28 TaxID=2819108 RepID=UPI001BE87CE8